MRKTIDTIVIGSDSSRPETLDIDIEFPTQCPLCSVAYAESPLAAYYLNPENYDNNSMIALFFCPHCESFFMIEYIIYELSNYCEGSIIRIYPAPDSGSKIKFSDQITTLSPQFVNIYHQSQNAEFAGLNELCGMGYRKALEFLVKDFATYIHPGKKSQIESSFLGNCISTYIDNEKIKALATASAWLGNDETHYIRKNQNYNLQDLKRFIDTLVAFIEYELNYKEATNFLSNPR